MWLSSSRPQMIRVDRLVGRVKSSEGMYVIEETRGDSDYAPGRFITLPTDFLVLMGPLLSGHGPCPGGRWLPGGMRVCPSVHMCVPLRMCFYPGQVGSCSSSSAVPLVLLGSSWPSAEKRRFVGGCRRRRRREGLWRQWGARGGASTCRQGGGVTLNWGLAAVRAGAYVRVHIHLREGCPPATTGSEISAVKSSLHGEGYCHSQPPWWQLLRSPVMAFF